MARVIGMALLCGCLGPVSTSPVGDGDADADTDADADADADTDADLPNGTKAIELILTWDTAEDDLDLHLLRVGGAFQSSDDCYYANCIAPGLDWGVAGDAQNPILEQDDITGTGPEILVYDQPYGAGPFVASVHDYGLDPGIGPTTATLEVYLDGVLTGTLTTVFTSDENYIDMAEIDAVTGQVVDLTP